MQQIRLHWATDGSRRWGRSAGGRGNVLLLPPLVRVRQLSVARPSPAQLLSAWRSGLLWEQFLAPHEPAPDGWRLDPHDDFSSVLSLAFCEGGKAEAGAGPGQGGEPGGDGLPGEGAGALQGGRAGPHKPSGGRAYALLDPQSEWLADPEGALPDLFAGPAPRLDSAGLIALGALPWLFPAIPRRARLAQSGALLAAILALAAALVGDLPQLHSGAWLHRPQTLGAGVLRSLRPAPQPPPSPRQLAQVRQQIAALERAAQRPPALAAEPGQLRLLEEFAALAGGLGGAWSLQALETEAGQMRLRAVFASPAALTGALELAGRAGRKGALLQASAVEDAGGGRVRADLSLRVEQD